MKNTQGKNKINFEIHLNVNGAQKKSKFEKITHRVVENFILEKIIKPCSVFLSVDLVSKAKMRALNSKYRKKNSATDILSFEQDLKNQPKGRLFLGDLVICREVMKTQAKEQNHSIYNEYCVLLTHGILHLLGYDHEKNHIHELKMRKLEQKLIKRLNIRTGLIKRTVKIKQ